LHIIAIDAMGGDNSPVEIVKGAVTSLNQFLVDKKIKIILVGKENIIRDELKSYTYDENLIEIKNATEIIKSDEAAMSIRTKKDSSIVVGLNLLKENKADSFISAGSTGALLSGATLKIKRINGISRPALATLLPNKKGFSLMLDSGANVDCKPSYLLDFSLLGIAYMENVLGIENPRVGLVNVGTEKEKGNTLTKEVYEILSSANINFIGNIEARDISSGICDVVVCDGFAGNLILKTAEGYSKFIFDTIKKELTSNIMNKIGAFLSKKAFKKIKKSFDYAEIGGAPFLGLTSLVIKTHGSATHRDIVGAINQSYKFYNGKMIEKLEHLMNLTTNNKIQI